MLDGDPNYRRKNSLRLEGYDYSLPGAYFATICVRDRKCILGRIERGRLIHTALGRIVASVWNGLPSHYPHVSLDEFVVMPNHVHGIIVINDVGVGFKPAPTNKTYVDPPVGVGYKPTPTIDLGTSPRHGLSEIVRGFKTYSSRQINAYQKTAGNTVWQRGYWDRVVRDDEEFNHIREYIQFNPCQWVDDDLYASQAA